MNVTIEHVFCRYSDEAEEIYFRIMNTILFATDETELRASMERLKTRPHSMSILYSDTEHTISG